MPPRNIADLGPGRLALHHDPSLRLVRPSPATRWSLKNLKPDYTPGIIKQMVWLCWSTLHLTILLNPDR